MLKYYILLDRGIAFSQFLYSKLWASIVDLGKGGLESLFVGVGLAFLNESLGVLERVVIELLALVLEGIDHGSEAVEVLDLGGLSSSDEFHMLGIENLVKDSVNFNSVGNFGLESGMVLLSWVGHNLVIVVVELDISGVNSEGVLSLISFNIELKGIIEHVKTIMDHLSPEISAFGISVRLEISDWLRGEIELTPLKDWRFGG